MKDGVTSAISCCCTTVCLATFAKFQTLTSKGTLVDFSFRGAGEGQTKRFKFKDHLRGKAAHVLDGILITKPIRALDSVISMPTPIILGHVCKSGIDTTLCCHGVRAGWENFSDACRLQPMTDTTSGGAETSTASTNHHSIVTVIENLIATNGGRSDCAQCRRRLRSPGYRAPQPGQHDCEQQNPKKKTSGAVCLE